VTTIPISPLWAILFFFMMLVLGLDTMMASVEITITSLLDIMPFFKRTNLRRVILITSICVVYFLLGIPYTLSSGTYWVFLVFFL
jgi:SNF family Na+-dependent transporter